MAKPKPFPTKEQVIQFIRESPAPVTRREIARAFHITGEDRIPLKALMKELEGDGVIDRGRGRKVAPPSSLPGAAIVVVSEIDADGEVIARPAQWDGPGPPPRIFMAPGRRGHPALGKGDRVLARLKRLGDGTYEGRTLKRFAEEEAVRIVGVFRTKPGGGVIEPAEKRSRTSIFVPEAEARGLGDGELVVAELTPGPRYAPKRATILDRLGPADHPRSISLIAIHAAGIPVDFPQEAVSQAEAAKAPILGDRTDLRALPLVTIDGADARDFDDAVWAEPDADPANEGGWHLLVAIADVAHYVTAGSALDREAFKRGNSCYFPDRVVPMLPEALSNGLCSLRPGEDRACMAVHMWIDRNGNPKRHRFVRGLMRSAARLTYEQVQNARNGAPDDTTGPLLETVIAPLYGAFQALSKARDKRGTLELDLPEKRIRLTPDGEVEAIGTRSRLDSHRLIEEFMIAANVAAAATLQERGSPCLYRVHDAPDPARLQAVRDFLAPFGYRIAKGQVIKPRMFTQILAQAKDRPEEEVVNQMILRSQAQAVYSPDNIGHFGLALARYAHFTSPIRRYADLTVHRALIRQLRLGGDGAPDEESARLAEIGEHVSFTERRAAAAERDATDRYVASWLSERIGMVFPGRIGGVTRFGLFVTLAETGADGLIPIASLPDDFYNHDERAHALVGRRWGRSFHLGASVRVKLIEANPITGSTIFRLVEGGEDAPAGKPRRRTVGKTSTRKRR